MEMVLQQQNCDSLKSGVAKLINEQESLYKLTLKAKEKNLMKALYNVSRMDGVLCCNNKMVVLLICRCKIDK